MLKLQQKVITDNPDPKDLKTNSYYCKIGHMCVHRIYIIVSLIRFVYEIYLRKHVLNFLSLYHIYQNSS